LSARKRVAVVGVGTMGSQALWRLASRGAEVVGFERFAPGHDRSAAGGDTRIFRTAHFEDTRYVPLLQHADRLWRELEAETGRELRRLTGCLLMGEAEHAQMRTVRESVTEHGLDHQVLGPDDVRSRFPAFRMYDGDVAVLDRHAGFIRPEQTVLAAATRAEQLGARIERYTTVKEIEEHANGVDIITDRGTEHVDAAVVTVGPWTADLLPQFSQQVVPRRLINAWFLPTDGTWQSGHLPAFIRTSPTHFYGVPSPDGDSVKVGLSVKLHRRVEDPNRLERNVDPEELDIFRELVSRYLPGLGLDPVRLSVYMEGYTATSRPLVGRMPASDKVFVLAGFSGHGFKLSPAMGDVAADLALDGCSGQPIDFLGLAEAAHS
jgi:sarcosine oxidase